MRKLLFLLLIVLSSNLYSQDYYEQNTLSMDPMVSGSVGNVMFATGMHPYASAYGMDEYGSRIYNENSRKHEDTTSNLSESEKNKRFWFAICSCLICCFLLDLLMKKTMC